MGTKEKHWVKDQQQFSWLFKQARSRKNETLGEDWCECLVHGLACLIGVPSACVTPAICKGNRGLVSRSFKKPGERLEHGNELLSRVIPDYRLDTERENQLYCPLNVFKALEGISSPIPMDGFSAYDVWSSYLLLDAWVAGRDRHHQNWGVLRCREDEARLAPSFDHGNALGFQVPERELAQYIDRGVESWCRRGRSHHFSGKPMLTDLAAEALRAASPEAQDYWTGRLEDVKPSDVVELLEAVPREILSEQRGRFILELLQVNRRRLLDAIWSRTCSSH